MASTHAQLRMLAQTHNDISDMMARANQFMAEVVEGEQFVTLFFGRLEPGRRILHYASAGHPAGYVVDREGNLKTSLPSTAMPLGVAADAEFPLGDSCQLDSGDVVLLPTDGIQDAESPGGQRFGKDRILEALRSHRDKNAREMINAILGEVIAFSQSDKPQDDMTIIVVKVQDVPADAPRGQ